MATYYLSKAAANGIPAGSGSGDGSISNPFLTPAEALTALSGGSGDILYVNDGIYTVTAQMDLYLMPGLSILGVTDYGATIRATTAITRLIWMRSTGITFGKVIFDSGTLNASLLDDASGAHAICTIDGAWFRHGGSFVALLFDCVTDLVCTGGFIFERTAIGNDPFLRYEGEENSNTDSTLTMDDGTIIEKYANSSYQLIFVDRGTSIGRIDIDISDLTFQIDDTAVGSGHVVGVYAAGCDTVDIYNLHVDNANSDLSGRFTLVQVANDAYTCSRARVHDITARLANGTNSGVSNVGVLIGTDGASGTPDSISNAVIENCTITGTSHGFLLGDITGGVVRKCRVDLALSGIVLKLTNSCRCEGNILTRCNNHYILNKQGTNDIIQFNTLQTSAGYSAVAFRVGPDSGDSVNPTIQNNVVEAPVQIIRMFEIDATVLAASTIRYNNVYSDVALPANSFLYIATQYSTLAAFETGASGAGGTVSDNTAHDPDLQSDFSIPSTSSASGIAVNTWTATSQIPPSGYNDAVPSWDMDPGAMVDQTKPFHPLNL